ncbi:hypothetical protein [Cupriavidus necator]
MSKAEYDEQSASSSRGIFAKLRDRIAGIFNSPSEFRGDESVFSGDFSKRYINPPHGEPRMTPRDVEAIQAYVDATIPEQQRREYGQAGMSVPVGVNGRGGVMELAFDKEGKIAAIYGTPVAQGAQQHVAGQPAAGVAGMGEHMAPCTAHTPTPPSAEQPPRVVR